MSRDAHLARRAFLLGSGGLLGGIALHSLLRREAPPVGSLAEAEPKPTISPPVVSQAHRAKRVIFLFQSGGPSQMDLFDEKPRLQHMQGQVIPSTILKDALLPRQARRQKQLPIVGSPYRFKPAGKCGMNLSELLPHLAGVADEITLLRAVQTTNTEHMPAATKYLTGDNRAGRPSLGSWVTYGFASESQNLPEFAVLLSGDGGQPLHGNFWGSGFLSKKYAGVQFRSANDLVLYLKDPDGLSRASRRRMLDSVGSLNREHLQLTHDPEIQARIDGYEQAFRMQESVPELNNLASEPAEVLKRYGVTPGEASYAANCLIARRMVERGVRFVQLCHRDWDHHQLLPANLEAQTKTTDQASAALIWDLKRLGMLDETLVVWGGEFGRTSYSQGEIKGREFGRDHHPLCFSMWMAGGGLQRGLTYGETDDFAFNPVSGIITIHDLHATILHLLGFDHTRLTYRYQGRDFRLTDTAGNVVREILA